MEIKKGLFLMAFVITLLLLSSIIMVNRFLENGREDFIDTELSGVINSFNEMQSLMLMGDTYGDRMVCIIFENRLGELDKSLWELGQKIDQYRTVSEEFFKSPYYLQQKKIFNEKQVVYLHLARGVNQKCNFSQPIILFFYQNSADCKKCDDQSFVLTDINEVIDDEISIFSFDMDLNLTTLSFLTEYYGINEYPCIVVEDKKLCGMQDKKNILKTLCEVANLSIC